MAPCQLRWRSRSIARWRSDSGSASAFESESDGLATVGDDNVGGEDEAGDSAQANVEVVQARSAESSQAARHETRGRIAVDPPTAKRNGRDRDARETTSCAEYASCRPTRPMEAAPEVFGDSENQTVKATVIRPHTAPWLPF